jgi:hypothetical protein
MAEPAHARIRPPSPALLALEGRAWLEFAALLPALPFLTRAPRGDGHPVLVLPGWLASDVSTRALRWFLRNRGYHAHGWRLGRNMGPTPDTVAGLGKRFLALRERHGRKLTLIGWSLGGIYARELSRHFPSEVRQVITLASPFRDVSATSVSRLLRRGPGEHRPPLAAALPVPTTAIYSRTDGIVAWRSCLAEDGPRSESIEVVSSHCGMGHHPGVLLVIADRLSQGEGTWRPYANGAGSAAVGGSA